MKKVVPHNFLIMYGDVLLQSKEDLYQYYSDKEIYDFYFSEYELDSKYKSLIRDEEDGSFMFSIYNDEIVWRDFGRSFKPKDLILLISILHNLNFYDTLRKIYNDLKSSNISYNKKIINPNSNNYKSELGIKCSFNFTNNELEYWKQGLFTRENLIYYKIYTGEIYSDKKLIAKSEFNNPLFIYLFDKHKKIWKSYKPYSENSDYKFLSNNISDHIQGYDHLKYKSDTLIITKAYKDVMVINKLDQFEAIAPHNEVIFITPWELDYLKTKYKRIYILFDNDETGIKYSKYYSELYNLPELVIPNNYSFGNKIIKNNWNF